MFELSLLLDGNQKPAGCLLGEEDLKSHCLQALGQQLRLATSTVSKIEISVQMLNRESMKLLNQQYRDKDSATNVLSFESGMPVLGDSADDGAGNPNTLLVLGDLVFCPDVIAYEARQQGKSEADHWAHMVVHGTLHLCGYDHLEPADAIEMENLEIQILSGIGIPNPYQIQSVQ